MELVAVLVFIQLIVFTKYLTYIYHVYINVALGLKYYVGTDT